MQASATSIRQATVDDLEELFRVHQASVRGLCSAAYSVQHIETWFTGRSPEIYLPLLNHGQVLLAEVAYRVVGFVGSQPGEVTTLFVRPELAGQGIGRALFLRGLSHAQQSFTGPITVVATTNAIPFYKGFGFEPVEEGWFVRGSDNLRYPVTKMFLRAGEPHRERDA